MANESKEEVEYFTDEQQEFLAKNRHFFAYLMRLFEGESPKQIAEKFNLSQRSTDKYLIGLERYGLIRVSGKQKVKPAFKNVPSLGRGPLGRAHFEALIRNSATFFVENVKEAMALGHLPAEERRSVSFSTLGARLTRATFKEWEDEQEKLRQIYLRRAEYEEKTKPRGDLMHLVVTQAYTLLPLEHPSLKILDESFGPITNF